MTKLMEKLVLAAQGVVILLALVLGFNALFPATPGAAISVMSLTPSPEPPTTTPVPTGTSVLPTNVPATATPVATTPLVPPTEPPAATIPVVPPTDVPPTNVPPTEPPAATIPVVPPTNVPATQTPTVTVPAVPPTNVPVDVVIEKTASTSVVAVGDPVRWTLRVRNIGGIPAQNVVISDQLPTFFTGLNVTATSGDAFLEGSLVTVALDDLQPNQTVEVWIDGTIASLDGDLVNIARVTTSTTETTTSNNVASARVSQQIAGEAAPIDLAPAPSPEAKHQTLPMTANDGVMPFWLPIGLIGLVVCLSVIFLLPSRTWGGR